MRFTKLDVTKISKYVFIILFDELTTFYLLCLEVAPEVY